MKRSGIGVLRFSVYLSALIVGHSLGSAVVGYESDVSAQQAVESSEVRTLAVVPISFAGQSSRPTTQARIGNMFFNSPDTDKQSESVASYWALSSYGREELEGKVFPLTPIDSKSTCNEETFDTWASQVTAYWEARGETIRQYDHLIIVMPHRKCDFGGWAYTPGKLIVINQLPSDWVTARTRSAIVLSTIAHELLHNLGYDHSGIVGCERNGKAVSLGGECKETSRYKHDWDPYEIITSKGYWPKHLLNSFQRLTLGFISEEEHVHLTQAGTFQVNLNPIEFAESETKALVVRRLGLNQYVTPTYDDEEMTTAGAPDICIEWHQPKGWFNNFSGKASIARGVSMRLCDVYSGGLEYQLEEGSRATGLYRTGTRLIDTTPGSKRGKADWTDAQLTKGTWTDEFSGVTIRVVGFDKPGTDRSEWNVQLEVIIP